MNLEFSLNLQDLENLFTKSNCSCHFINPNKTRIILWKEIKDEAVTYYLRLGIQKFISYPLTDKNGETYWRFKSWEKEGVSTSELTQKEAVNSELSQETPATPDPDPITKFNQRQAKAINPHDAANSATNHSG